MRSCIKGKTRGNKITPVKNCTHDLCVLQGWIRENDVKTNDPHNCQHKGAGYTGRYSWISKYRKILYYQCRVGETLSSHVSNIGPYKRSANCEGRFTHQVYRYSGSDPLWRERSVYAGHSWGKECITS